MLQCADLHEDARIRALYDLEVLDTAPEPAFDRITRMAKTVMQVPIALVSLIDRDRQWFKSRQGIAISETARDISLCTWAIRQDEPMIVPDALNDPRFAENPLVTGDLNIRFYIGVPLKDRNGFNVGTLCCLDRRPREPSDEQVALLQDLACLVTDELELRLLATTDGLTGVLTRRAFFEEARRDVLLSRRHDRDLTCVMIDVDHFKPINDAYGHAAGDQVLRTIGAICRSELRASDYIGRLGGEEFALVLRESDLASGIAVADRVREMVGQQLFLRSQKSFRATMSAGVATLDPSVSDIDMLLQRADAALYKAKDAGRNRTISYTYAGEEPAGKPEARDDRAATDAGRRMF